MAADHPPKYWQAVARGLEAESDKAAIYLNNHGPSIGTARELIFRRLIENETPQPFVIKNGIIRCSAKEQQLTSRQCDIVVYDAEKNTPFYRFENFVVVPDDAVRVVIEIKSHLSDNRLDQINRVCQSVRPMKIPLLAFCYKGMKFETFVKKMSDKIRADSTNSPQIIANHKQNYIGIRCTQLGERFYSSFLVIDLSSKHQGAATANFLEWYSHLLSHPKDTGITPGQASDWFKAFDLPSTAKVAISKDGEVGTS